MRTIISVGGTWHAPHMASQLDSLGMLDVVYTTTPAPLFTSRAWIPKNRIKWVLPPEFVGSRIGRVIPSLKRFNFGSPYWYSHVFDKCVEFDLPRRDFDVFVAFSRFGLACLRRVHTTGCATIVERGSAHTVARQKILADEYDSLGENFAPLQAGIVDRELEEYELADYVVVPSQFAYNSFVQQGFPISKIVRIPYGVDTERFRPTSRKNIDRPFGILSIGNLGVEKGTIYLLRALQQAQIPDTELVLVGSLDGFIKTRLTESNLSWQFCGAVQQQRLAQYYQQASVYCLLSVQEGLSMTVLEAMACGLPVIASENTGASDIITHGVDGYIVPVRQHDRVAELIAFLYEHPVERMEIGVAARRTAERYTWDIYGQHLGQAYRKIAQSKKESILAAQ